MSSQENSESLLSDEFIGSPPNHLTRYGISFILLFILLVITFSWYIDYSDTINTTTTLNTQKPTIIHQAERNGIIEQVLVNDGDRVTEDQVIMILHSDVAASTISHLKLALTEDQITIDDLSVLIDLHMGKFREDFQKLAEALHKINEQQSQQQLKLKIKQQQSHLLALRERLQQLNKQHDMLAQKHTIAERQIERSSQLAEQGLLSKTDIEQLNKNLLDAKINTHQIKVEQVELKDAINFSKQEIDILNNDATERSQQLSLQKSLLVQKLLDQITGWEKNHLLKANISGVVAIPYGSSPHQNIKAGQEIFSVIPKSNNLIGQIKVSENGTGKIRLGQKTRIQLKSYPAKEFGEIEGEVISKSPSIHDQLVFLDIAISGFNAQQNNIQTTYGKNIQYIPNMQGQVEIITNRKSLLKRVFEQLVAQF